MGGESGIRKLLSNSNLGVQELFTKLLQEPLHMCHCTQRKLVVVDALDETQYESREDFLDLIMNRFPLLPNWLVFFITSRPESTVQLSLKKYNPCVRICAGNVEQESFYQQHQQDIKLFLRNSVDFSRLSFAVDDLANKCNGSFLYAFYIAKDFNSSMQSGKSFQLVDLFPGDFDSFLRKNFKRVFDKVGSSLFKKLFGCAIAALAPLPVSFISYVLQREKSSIPEQHVLDALSLFMVLSKTYTFLHNLIPAWLTDKDNARELFIDRTIEAAYLKDVIHEILFGFIREQSQGVALKRPDLLDYVLRVGIRFLSGFPGKDSSETVFSCLTSFKYIQNRIKSRRIEICSLIEDFKLAADCQFNGVGKKEILLEVCSALERNIFVLLECPYLLHSCLQNSPNDVQENVDFPDSLSTACLQWNSSFLSSKGLCCHGNFALSPDRKLIAYINGLGEEIVVVDSCSLEMISNIKLEESLGFTSKFLEFSPDGKFLFLGWLHKWFSLEKRNYEDFPQFSGHAMCYEWGSFSLDKQWIVVKCYNFSHESSHACCMLCLLNFLCLWAAKEIGQRHETDECETICGCFPHRLLVQIQPSAGEDQDSSVPAMRILLNVLRERRHDEWCSLLEKLQLSYPFEAKCSYCPSRMRRETPTLTVVRDFVISHYNEIFKYQVWNVQTGKSALEQAFSSGVQLSPFIYLCHLGTALEKCGVLFSGVDKSLSLCNIALLNTVCHHLFFFDCVRESFIWKELKLFERFSIINSLTVLNSVVDGLFQEAGVKTAGKCSGWIHRKLLVEFERVNRIKHINTRLERLAVLEMSDSRLPEKLIKVLEKLEFLEKRERNEELEQMQVLEQSERQQQRKLLEQREEFEHSAEFEQLQAPEQIEEEQQRKLVEQIEELERSAQLEQMKVRVVLIEIQLHRELHEMEEARQRRHQCVLLKRLEKFIQLERLGQCGKLEEIKKFQKFVYSRYFKGHRAIRERDNLLVLHKLREKDKLLDLDKPVEQNKLVEENILEEDSLLDPDKVLGRNTLVGEDTLREEAEFLEQETALLELDKLLGLDELLEWKESLRLELDEPFVVPVLDVQCKQREREGRELFEACRLLLTPCEYLHQSWAKRFSQFKQLVHFVWYHLESNEKFEFVESFHFGTKNFTNAPLELQNLPDNTMKGLFTSILPCVSPDGKWIAIRLWRDKRTVQLYREQDRGQQHPHWRNSVHVIKDVERFAFTNDSFFCVYVTFRRSLHALSLASGTILTSVSGIRPLFFTLERHAGYRFQVNEEENVIFVKDFPPAFLSSFFPFVRADPMQVTFASADAILVLYSDFTLALMENDGTDIASETCLKHPSAQQVKKAQFSPDGKLIATHLGSNISLYRIMPASTEGFTDHECPDSVFESNDDFIVLHFTFSADSTLLLFCIRRNIGLSFFVWNVQKKVLSASFDSPGLMSEDCCCCFSLDCKELIICTELYIGFWDHTSRPCRLLRKVETNVPYSEVDKFTHCTFSPENDLLAYCITDRILLCPLKTSENQSILTLPRAHLGKVEFCQFLGGNRYLISYGVDGTVFLWDLSECRVASFAKIAQGRESIVSMAVSPKGDKVVCVTSFSRLNIIKPCGLKDALLSKLPLPKGMDSEKMTKEFRGQMRGQVREPTAAMQSLRSPDSTEDLDAADLRIAEMEFMLCSDDNEYSDEDSDELLD